MGRHRRRRFLACRPYRASRNGRGLVFRYADDPMHGTREGTTIYQWRDGDSMAFMFPSAPGVRTVFVRAGVVQWQNISFPS